MRFVASIDVAFFVSLHGFFDFFFTGDFDALDGWAF